MRFRLALAVLGLVLAVPTAFAQTDAPPAAPPPAAPPAAAPAPQLSRTPVLQRFVPAEAPPELAERGHVDVVLVIDIDETGKVVRVDVGQSGGQAFDDAAVQAARDFLFSPGEYQGKPVPVRITYRYKFDAPKPEPAPAPPAPTGTSVAPPAPAQPPGVPLAGRVLKKGERIPLGGVAVIIDGAGGADGGAETSTDADGRFAFDALPPGEHEVQLRSAEVWPGKLKLTLKPGTRLDVTWYLEARERYRSVVKGQKVVQETVETVLSGDELKHIPGTAGDTLKAVQNLPGVARAPFGGGQLIVWGSSPQDTRTYVDGVYIPVLYHFGGLRATVPSEFVDSLTFLPGGYGVEYGRGLGGAVEIETQRPRSDGYHGFLQLDLIDGQLRVEGPITKKLTFAVGVRRSWIDSVLPIFTRSDFQLSPVYYDYQAQLAAHPTTRDDIDFFLFGSDDDVHLLSKNPDPELALQFRSHIYYHRALVRWTHRFARTTLTVTPSIGWDVPAQFKGSFGNIPISIDQRNLSYNLRAVARTRIAPWLRLDSGLDFEGNHYFLDIERPSSGSIGGAVGSSFGAPTGGVSGGYSKDSLGLDLVRLGPFLTADFKLGPVTVTPQLRLDTYVFSGYAGTPNAFQHAYFLPEPRLSMRWDIRKWVAVKGAIGVYHEAPGATSFSQSFGDPNVKPEFALHYVLGAEFRPTSTLHIEVEGFYKDLRSLIVGAERQSDPRQFNDGVGRTYGGELLIRQELWKGFYGWVAYTLSRSERHDHPDEPWHLFQYDQTHILTLIASYKFSHGYQVGVRFRYVTGNPYTPVIGAYYDVGDVSYHSIRGPDYSSRLGSFNQLDVRFDKTWAFRLWKLGVYIDLQNVYARENPEGMAYNYNYTKSAPVSGLPFLPVFGVRGEF